MKTLKTAIIDEQLEWGALVLQANTQMCTPLWYVRLQQDELLQYLPNDMQEYLKVLYDSNLSRNQQLEAGLEELLAAFEKEHIDTVLLKGAATFVDRLYEAPGARFMGDLDILVPQDKVALGRQLLLDAGFEEVVDAYMEPIGEPTDIRHHQIQRLIKPGTPIAVELHFNVAYGQAGRVIRTRTAWENAESMTYRGHETKVLSPDYRVLHNAIHGLLPHREFLKGEISLLQLAEFSALAMRYRNKINWVVLSSVCAKQNLSDELYTYVGLARNLMSVDSTDLGVEEISKWHLGRVVTIGARNTEAPGADVSWCLRCKLFVYKMYYILKLPSWFWRNVSYAVGEGALRSRIRLLLSRLFKVRSWKKI